MIMIHVVISFQMTVLSIWNVLYTGIFMLKFSLAMQDGLDCESFENYRSGLIAKLLEKDPSLQYETNRFWGQIIDKRYNQKKFGCSGPIVDFR